MLHDDATGDRQAQAGSLRLVGQHVAHLSELLEDSMLVDRANPDAIVAHGDDQIIPVFGLTGFHAGEAPEGFSPVRITPMTGQRLLLTRAVTVIRPWYEVNLMALSTRFVSTWLRRSMSPKM